MNQEKMTNKTDPQKKNVYAGILLFIVFLLFFLLSFSIEIKRATGSMTSRSVPQVISVLGMIVSLYMVLKNLMAYRAKKKNGGVETEEVPVKRWTLMGLSVVLLIAYVGSMRAIGFILSSILYLFLQMVSISEDRSAKRVVLLAVIAIAVPILFYIPFRYGFKLMLPIGTLFK